MKTIKSGQQTGKQYHAIIISMSKYKDTTNGEWNDLPGAGKDMEELKVFLIPYFDLTIIENSDNIIDDVLDKLKAISVENKKNWKRLFIAYSGQFWSSDLRISFLLLWKTNNLPIANFNFQNTCCKRTKLSGQKFLESEILTLI